MIDETLDQTYLQLLTSRIDVCKAYKPKFGQAGTGVSLEAFRSLYGADSFYVWFGLDDPLVYAAHKAAGGITSIYRQIGIGSEALFRQILQDHLGLTAAQSVWSYVVTTPSGQARTLQLDGRIEPDDIRDPELRQRVSDWMRHASQKLGLESRVASAMRGLVMEVRQGYKSKDSKRQNADIANAAEAYTRGYLPLLVMLSAQIDGDVLERYARGKWLVLHGRVADADAFSTYTFVRDIIGYDLAGFFERHRESLRSLVKEVLEHVLSANDDD